MDTTKKTLEICCSTQPGPLPEDVHERLDSLYQEKLGVKPDSNSD